MKKVKRIYLFFSFIICLLLSACGDDSYLEKDSSTEETDQTDTPDITDTTDITDASVDTEHITTTEVGIDLYGTYDQNDLMIKTLNKEYEGIMLEIPQLEYVTYGTLANFANVISIGVYLGGGDNYSQFYLNYNLVNGNRLTFEEMFLTDTDTLGIIRDAFRSMLIKNQMQADYDENELYKIVKRYSESKDKVFAFTPSSIMLYYKDYVATVNMLDIAEEVSIYSKYLTDAGLYSQNDIGRKDIFTCVEVPEEAFDVWENGFLEENLWYDYTAYKEYFGDDIEETNVPVN